jgi:hypothetical protein
VGSGAGIGFMGVFFIIILYVGEYMMILGIILFYGFKD